MQARLVAQFSSLRKGERLRDEPKQPSLVTLIAHTVGLPKQKGSYQSSPTFLSGRPPCDRIVQTAYPGAMSRHGPLQIYFSIIASSQDRRILGLQNIRESSVLRGLRVV